MSQTLILILVLLFSFLIKAPALNHPLTGHFGSYQVVNGMMAYMMDWHSLSSLVIPKTFIIMNGKPSLHLLYYPFASLLASGFHSFIGGTIDFWGRFQAAFFMFLSSLLVYVISAKRFNQRAALVAAALFAFSPMVLITGISFQNEAIGLFFLLASYWALISYRNGLWIFLSGILFSLALTARIHFLVCFPAFLITLIRSRVSPKNVILFMLAASLPLGAWLGFTYDLSQRADYVMTSFFGQVSEGRILAFPILKDLTFYRRALEILAGEWLTPILIPFLVVSLFLVKKEKLPFIFWVLGSLSLFVLIPEKVTNHSFYLLCGVPAACILAAVLIDQIRIFSNYFYLALLFGLFFLFSIRYYLPPMLSPSRPPFKEIPEMGAQIQGVVGKDDWIIASRGTSPELLYYSGRFGWPFGVDIDVMPLPAMPLRHRQAMEAGYGKPIEWLEHLRKEGAKYFVVGEVQAFRGRVEFFDYVRKRYNQVANFNDTLLIFDVSQPLN